jgi:type I restriction enzyme, S subunit
MKAGWQLKTLGEVLEKTETVNPLQHPYTEFDYIDVSSVSNSTFEIEQTQRLKGKDAPSRARKLVKANDVIFATIRPTLRRIAIVPPHLDKQVCSTGYFVLRPKPILEYRFVYYWLFAEEFMGQMEALQKGASYPAVTDKEVRDQAIPFPSLIEQQRIVTLLDKAFAHIATAKANAEQNLQNARELFGSQAQAMLEGVGNDWERVSLSELLERGWIVSHLDGNHGGDYPRKEEFVNSGVPYISAKALKDGQVDFGESKYLSIERAATIRKGLAKDRDVLFAHNATVGPVAILSTDEDVVILGTSLTYYRCDQKNIHPEYLAHFMRSPPFITQYSQVMGQSTRNQVPITKQREFFHVIPSFSEQMRIASNLDILLEQTERLERTYQQKITSLDELKKSLLHQAFAGLL